VTTLAMVVASFRHGSRTARLRAGDPTGGPITVTWSFAEMCCSSSCECDNEAGVFRSVSRWNRSPLPKWSCVMLLPPGLVLWSCAAPAFKRYPALAYWARQRAADAVAYLGYARVSESQVR